MKKSVLALMVAGMVCFSGVAAEAAVIASVMFRQITGLTVL